MLRHATQHSFAKTRANSHILCPYHA